MHIGRADCASGGNMNGCVLKTAKNVGRQTQAKLPDLFTGKHLLTLRT